jgi:hypothetical protein
MAQFAHPHERKVTQASIPIGGHIQSSHADKQCCVQDPVKLYIEDDGGTPGLACTLSWNRSGERPSGGSSRNSWRVITMRTESQGRKARLIADVTSTALGEELVVCL